MCGVYALSITNRPIQWKTSKKWLKCSFFSFKATHCRNFVCGISTTRSAFKWFCECRQFYSNFSKTVEVFFSLNLKSGIHCLLFMFESVFTTEQNFVGTIVFKKLDWTTNTFQKTNLKVLIPVSLWLKWNQQTIRESYHSKNHWFIWIFQHKKYWLYFLDHSVALTSESKRKSSNIKNSVKKEKSVI